MADQPAGDKDFERSVEDLERREAELKARRAQLDIIDEEGESVEVAPKWDGKVLTIQGKEIQVKVPQPAAVQYIGAFGMGTKGLSQGVMTGFLWRHISEFSIGQIEDWSFNGEITEKFYDELFSQLIELGTNRPTERS